MNRAVALTVTGLLLVVVAAFLLHPAAGFGTLGLVLTIAGLFLDFSE